MKDAMDAYLEPARKQAENLYKVYLQQARQDQDLYDMWLAGVFPGEPAQMVIQMFKSWMEESPRMMVDANVDPTFRGVPFRWLERSLRDANTKAGEG